MMMPLSVLSSASIRLTTTRSWSGRNFIGVSLALTGDLTVPQASLAHCASKEGILDTLVQPVNSTTRVTRSCLCINADRSCTENSISLRTDFLAKDTLGFGRGFRLWQQRCVG